MAARDITRYLMASEVFLGMDIRAVKKAARLTEWSEMVRACKNSGLTVNAWCEKNGIQPKTYYHRQQRVFEALPELRGRGAITEQVSEGSARATKFVNLAELEEEKCTGTITIQLRGARVVVEDGVDAILLEKVLAAVSRTC